VSIPVELPSESRGLKGQGGSRCRSPRMLAINLTTPHAAAHPGIGCRRRYWITWGMPEPWLPGPRVCTSKPPNSMPPAPPIAGAAAGEGPS